MTKRHCISQQIKKKVKPKVILLQYLEAHWLYGASPKCLKANWQLMGETAALSVGVTY